MRITKQIIIGTVGALVMGLLLHLVLPALLGVLLAGGASGLTILDPLYAGDRVSTIWEVFGVFMAVQATLALVFAPLSGGVIGWMANRWKSGWIFLTGPIASLVVHGAGAIMILLLTGLLAGDSVGVILATTIIIVLSIAPLIGLVSALLIYIFARDTNN
ncbi:MAG: hypothetical protein DWQ07_03275 [Chloroflexi bacterium]|nr:MAG: hypothetical protein DWQ07_03275 [Chloroflexota bacterium]MBL1193478.1 hypothetical protein [Chloroflexota bacterium]NOH10769.1 hypothetical protein [Chloroflexota bacterium]